MTTLLKTITATKIDPKTRQALLQGALEAGTRYRLIHRDSASTVEFADATRTTIRVGSEYFETYDL